MIRKIKYQLKKKRRIEKSYLFLLGMVSLFLLVGGFSYAMFTAETERRGTLNIITGNLYSFLESEELNQHHQLVLGSKESKIITITLTNVNPIDAKFHLWYEAVDGVSVSYDDTKDIPPTKEGFSLVTNDRKIYQLKVTNNTNDTQTITFGSEAGLSTKTLTFPEGKRIIEEITPRIELDSSTLDSAMIPVVYNGSTWVKAGDADWYDYDSGKWANAVTVTSASRSKYQSASAGLEVVMTDIETMWVYIPRYSYTIGSEDGENYYGKQGIYLEDAPTQALPGEIDIKFIDKSEKDTGSAQYKVAEGVSGWRTPDAFTFGNQELSGIWVGKFETSSNDPHTEYGGGNNTALSPIIKPNRPTWRNISVANLGEVSRKISATGNDAYYGVSGVMDSHAMKNSEWAAVAYLSQSKYGKLGNLDYSGANKEIYQNVSQYTTGCSYGVPSSDEKEYGCHYTYDTPLSGTGASTTGTIYGIYDMVGGSWEYVMGIYSEDGKRYVGSNSGHYSGYTGILADGTTFTGKDWLPDKYYDIYDNNHILKACGGKPCVSHAVSETSGWYHDFYYYDNWLALPNTFAYRGGGSTHGIGAGIFMVAAFDGEGYYAYNNSFRVTMIQT